MKFDIIAEGHEGVISVDQETLATVEAEDAEAATKKFAETYKFCHYNAEWGIWLIGARKIWVKQKEHTNDQR